jgi:putative salt-induced outer membrane protein YdiY
MSALSVLLLSMLEPAVADEVILRNGDQLTGDVLRQEGSELLLMTDYAGEISIDWAQVREVRLDEPAPALLENDEVIAVAAVTREQERLHIRRPSPRQAMSLPPEQIQIIEPEPWEIGDGYDLSGIVNLGLQDANGNSPSTELDLDFELNYQRRWHEWQTYGQLEYDTTDGVQTTENWTLLNKYSRRFPRSPWYGSAWLRIKHDRFADLRLRYLVGPAIGYQFDGSDRIRLSAEVGPIYLREDFYEQRDNTFWGPGLFIDYEQDLIAERLQFYFNGMGFSTISSQTKDLWVSWAGLRVPLVGGFVGSLEYEIDYDGQPAEGTKTTDNTLRLKIGYQW